MNVKLIKDWVGILSMTSAYDAITDSSIYLAETGGKDNNLIYLSHFFQEVVDPRPLKNVEMMPVVLDFNGDDKIRLLYCLANVNN
jgi:hypothetical protein